MCPSKQNTVSLERRLFHEAFATSSRFHHLFRNHFLLCVSRITCQLLMICMGCVALSGNNAISIPNSSSLAFRTDTLFLQIWNMLFQTDTLTVKIKSEGAELSSIVHSGTGLEYMWQRTAPFWNKSSPDTVSNCWRTERQHLLSIRVNHTRCRDMVLPANRSFR